MNVFNVKDGFELSVFHVDIRSLNCNYRSLIMFLHSLEFKFDVLILFNLTKGSITEARNGHGKHN